MDFNRIELLLAKYWECETSLEEEKELKKFFNSGQVPDHLAEYSPLFQFYDEERKGGELGDLFDKEVLKKIEQTKPVTEKKGTVVKLFYDIARVAAVVTVLVTAGYFINQEYVDKKEEVDPYLTDTFEDPKAAFEETKRALQIISANFNKGRKEARKISVFHDAQEKAKDIEKEL